MQNSDKILTRYRHHTCKFKHVCMCLYLFQKCRHHTGSIETQYCSGEIHIHTHSSKYMHILFCLYWIQTCMYQIQTCLYDVCMCMYFFAHTYKISQLLCCLYVLKNTYKYKHAGSLMLLDSARALPLSEGQGRAILCSERQLPCGWDTLSSHCGK